MLANSIKRLFEMITKYKEAHPCKDNYCVGSLIKEQNGAVSNLNTFYFVSRK